MGFTTGFLGGVTLTAATLYLTMSLHTSNRIHQAALLRQQSFVLTNIVDPRPPPPPPTARTVQAGIIEMAKDRWNGEVEGLVKKAQTTDWRRVRETWEDRVAGVWSKLKDVGDKS